MNCNEIQERLSEYVDNRMNAEMSAVIESHLASCADCSEVFAHIAGTVRLLKAEPQVEPPMGLVTRVMAHVNDEPAKQSFWQRLFPSFGLNFSLQISAMVIVGVLVVFLYQKNHYSQPVSKPDEAERLAVHRDRDVPPAEIMELSPGQTLAPGHIPSGGQTQAGGDAAAGFDDRARTAVPVQPDAPDAGAAGRRADREIILRMSAPAGEGDALMAGATTKALSEPQSPAPSRQGLKTLHDARRRAVETGEAQSVWLEVPIEETERIRKEIGTLGTIESETVHRDELAVAASSDKSARIRVTILPPAAERK
jgi:anti-sigma factor RsiW